MTSDIMSVSEAFKEAVAKRSAKPEEKSTEPEEPSDGKSELEASSEGTPSRTSTAARKPLQKFGTQGEKAKTIYAFRNGDKHHTGVKVAVHPKKFKNLDQVTSSSTTISHLIL